MKPCIWGSDANAHIDREDFSFLNNEKFCQKGYAEHFTGVLKWYDASTNTKILNERVDTTSVERIKYLPQSYLEKLCNNEDGRFQEEINKVVFSRLDDSEKLGKRNFDELREYKSQLINQKISELKNNLEVVNKTTAALEVKAADSYKQRLENKLGARKQELENHNNDKLKIKIVTNPAENELQSPEQKKQVEILKNLNEEITELEKSIEEQNSKLVNSRVRVSELELIRDELVSMKGRFDTWQQERAAHYSQFDLDIRQMASLSVETSKVDQLIEAERKIIQNLTSLLSDDSGDSQQGTNLSLVMKLSDKVKLRDNIGADLEKPFKEWQEYQQLIKEWDAKYKDIVGTKDSIDSITFLESELSYLATGLSNDLAKQMGLRESLIRQIFAEKQGVQAIYNKIKVAISDILQVYSKEQNITIETAFKLDRLFYTRVFDYINRYGDFYQNGNDALRRLIEEYNFDDIDQIISFVHKFLSLDIRYKEGRKVDFYNYLSSLDYIDPEYDLRLNGKGLSQLSPGEKGGLLLIFYLVLDKDNKPLIIDQPEDNLDNQSVAEILVPYIKSAKSRRQIIMVTHNPNLAIVSDAEQIIYMDIDKENRYKVSSISGAIENPIINNHIVNILEGRMKAFNNRRLKYRKKNK